MAPSLSVARPARHLIQNSIALFLAAATVIMPGTLLAEESFASASTLVTAIPGDLPIILSAPHGGRNAVPDVPARSGAGVKRFVPRSDTNTAQLTELLSDAIRQRLGKRPYVVIARFHRKYIDANRPNDLAYESNRCKEHYHAYHTALRQARTEVTQRWGSGILLDIHGQASFPETIVRGTQNGTTTSFLCERFSRQALLGQTSLFGQFANAGFHILPPVDSDANEHPKYNGGYIVRTYGSRDGGTVDAIQLELGIALRSKDRIHATANSLAKAIEAYGQDYLPNSEQSTGARSPTEPASRVARVGIYIDKGAGKSRIRILEILAQRQDLSVTQLSAEDIRNGKLSKIDVLIQPGGSGSGQGNQLGAEGRTKIRDYVRSGGGYIGICGGAYLATAHYKWSLNILDAKVLDTKHWARGHGMVKIAVTDAGRSLLSIQDPQLNIQYWQGPLLAPAGRPEIDDYQTIATFETEIAQNGAPQGVMVGTTAIADGNFGQGRVICFSPHPELTDGLESLLKSAIDRVNKRNNTIGPQ